jgi:hypothetical protein
LEAARSQKHPAAQRERENHPPSPHVHLTSICTRASERERARERERERDAGGGDNGPTVQTGHVGCETYRRHRQLAARRPDRCAHSDPDLLQASAAGDEIVRFHFPKPTGAT